MPFTKEELLATLDPVTFEGHMLEVTLGPGMRSIPTPAVEQCHPW